MVAPLVVPDFESIAPVRAVEHIPETVPVLILAGGGDDLARPEEAHAIFERVRSHGRIEFFPGAAHHDLPTADPDRYRRLILDFCTVGEGE